MGKANRASGASVAGTEQSDSGPVGFRGRRMAVKDGSIEFFASDGGAPDTIIRRNSAGVVDLAGLALSGNATVAGAVDVAGSCSGIWGPRDNALVGASFDPDLASGTLTLTGGTIYLTKIPIARTATPVKLYWYVTTQATTATASQCWVSVLSSAGAILATPVDVATASESAGLKTTTVAPGSLAAGTFVWGAIVLAGSTVGTVAVAPASALPTLTNVGTSGATLRHATNGTAQTTITARTPASNTAGAAVWMGLGT